MKIKADISVGELIDKISILEIKLEKISDPEKNKNIQIELNLLESFYKKIKNNELDEIKDKLKNTNFKLWNIKDEIRECEKNKDFGDNFVELARSVYITNDQRFDLKNSINELFSSEIKEVKSYESY